MRLLSRIFFVSSLLCVVNFDVSSASNAPVAPKKAYSMTTEIDYKVGSKRVKQSSTMNIDDQNTGWSLAVPATNGVTVLGRIAKFDTETLQLEFLVLDADTKEVIMSAPRIVTLKGQQAEISSVSDTSKVSLTALVKPITYTTNQ